MLFTHSHHSPTTACLPTCLDNSQARSGRPSGGYPHSSPPLSCPEVYICIYVANCIINIDPSSIIAQITSSRSGKQLVLEKEAFGAQQCLLIFEPFLVLPFIKFIYSRSDPLDRSRSKAIQSSPYQVDMCFLFPHDSPKDFFLRLNRFFFSFSFGCSPGLVTAPPALAA